MTEILQRYFDAFNAGDTNGMLACLTDTVAHHVNEGQIRTGRAQFKAFCEHMSRCYSETLTDIVIFASPDGERGAAEYIVHGTYIATDSGLPEATGQSYCLPAGSFFSLENGLISRVTTYYNLSDWMRQVSQ